MSSTQFVLMYHPALGNRQATVPLQAVDDYEATGWLLVDPEVEPPAPSTPYYTTAAADSRFVRTTLLDTAMTAVAADTDSAFAVEQRAALVPRVKVSTPRPFAAETAITTPAIIAAIGVDPAFPGRVFGRNKSFGPVMQSDDAGATWSEKGSIPAVTATTIKKACAFKGNVYVLGADSTSGTYGLYRAASSAQAAAAPSWSGALKTLIPGTEGVSTGLNAGSQYLFLGEYESDGVDIAAAGGPMIHRSVDGTTWQTVWGPDPAVKHVHAVAEDPYNPGHIYATLGDNGASAGLIRSTQHGAPGTWETVLAGGANEWQAVQISFSEEWIWLASDRFGFSVAVVDRETKKAYNASTNWHHLMAVPGGAAGDRFFQLGFYGAVDPDTGIYYLNVSDTSSSGNTFGNFYLPAAGAALQVHDFGPLATFSHGNGEVFITGGRVFIGNRHFPKFALT